MKSKSELFIGTLYAVGAFTMWGVFPLYWRLLQAVPAYDILAHRTFWSFVVTAVLLLATGRARFLDLLKHRRSRRAVIASGLLLGTNWFTFIFAVNAGRVLDASLGYYINPLFSVFLGTVFLKERLTMSQRVAVGFAAAGVMVLAVGFRVVPWTALILMSTFGLYGLVKKTVALDALSALAAETLVLAPLALVVIVSGLVRGTGALGRLGLNIDLLLIFGGAVTALPLYWFAQGTKRIPLSRVGFIQYIAPTLMLLVGAVIFGEAFTPIHAVSFGLIWTGLTLYSASHSRQIRALDARIESRLRLRLTP